MPHEIPGSLDAIPRLNLAHANATVELALPNGNNRLAVQLAPALSHAVGIGAAVAALEWSMDHENWAALLDPAVMTGESGQVFAAFKDTNQVVSGGGNGVFADVTWTDQIRADAAFSHTLDGAEVTINKTGPYMLHINAVVDGGAGDIGQIRLAVNGTPIDHSISKEGILSATPLTIDLPHEFARGDVVKVQAARMSGSGSVTAAANGCRLTIVSLPTPGGADAVLFDAIDTHRRDIDVAGARWVRLRTLTPDGAADAACAVHMRAYPAT